MSLVKKTPRKSSEHLESMLDLLLEGEIAEVLVHPPAPNHSVLEKKVWDAAKMLSDYIHILNGLTEENYPQQTSLITGKNQLGNAIVKVVKSIASTTKLASDVKIALEEEQNRLIQEDWIKSQYATIFAKIQGVKAISDLGDIVLSEVAFSVQAQMGMFYIRENHDTGTLPKAPNVLKLIARYGISSEARKQEFLVGEGIVGQCALDLRPRYLEQVPEDFIHIESGLGSAPPGSVVIMPIVYEGELYGIFELAALHKFSDLQKRLIEQVAKSIGISIRSITGNMLTEKLLKEIAEKNNSLASQKQALDSSAIVAETDIRGRITYVNDKFLEISKYGRDELLGQDHRILNSRFHPKEFFIDLWKVIAKGEVWHGEVKNKAKDGTFYWVDTTIYPVKDDAGRAKKYVAIRFDITDKKRALEELQMATEKAKKAAAIKTEFLANMSHEIRTPMNAIIGMGDLLKETPLNVDQERHVNVLNNAGSALLDVINNILDLSKIESGQMHLENIQYDVEEVIYATLDIMGRSAHKKGLELVASIHPDVHTKIKGDPSRLRQVLINLLGNAIKFTESGEVVLRLEKNPQYAGILDFSVKDTGIGITEDKFAKIFESFSQANTSTSREYGGTGLGLAISKKIIESMGGKIGVESQLGRGSRFYFSIPDGGRSEKVALPAEVQSLKGLKALIIDSSRTICTSIQEMLGSWSMESDFAVDGAGAMEKVRAAQEGGHPYQVVILGFHLGGKNGIELARTLSSLVKEPPVYIVMLKSDDKRNELRRVRGVGVASYLVKPVRRQDLQQAVLTSLKKTTNKPLVLVTDDDDDLRREIAQLVRSMGAQVLEAANGKEALEIVKNNPVQVILSDVKMPEMDGITFFEETRKAGIATPFIFISGHMNNLGVSIGGSAEKIDFLDKPFHLNVLLDLVGDHLDRSYSDTQKKVEEPTVPPLPMKELRILLVDDVKENIDLIKVYLKKCPYHLDTAESGAEGIDKFMTTKYDLILMDIQMPMMDGHEAVRKIRQIEATQGLRPTTIVTLSAHALAEEMENSMNAGSNGYLTKPIKKKVLLEAIELYGNSPAAMGHWPRTGVA